MSYYFVIVGTLDNPLYEAHLTTSKSSVSSSVPPPSANSSPHPSYSVFGALTTNTALSATSSPNPATNGRSSVGYASKGTEKGRHVVQLVAHASLDVIEDVMWTEKSMYLKNVDRFHEWTVSAWLPPGGLKLVLLHEIKNDEGIRMFFIDAWDSFVRTQLSPFYELNAPITSTLFDAKLKASARKHL